MERRNFVKTIAIGGATIAVTPLSALRISTEKAVATIPVSSPLVHVRHGLYNPVLAKNLTQPIAGNWVYSFSSDVFARDGVNAKLGDSNPVSVSMFVGNEQEKELIHFLLEENKCNHLINNSLKSENLERDTPQCVHESSNYRAELIRCNESLTQFPVNDGELFVALISGKASVGDSILNSKQALFVDKHQDLNVSVFEESRILVVTRLA